jgi:dimethylhistidine N-methyltransferase
MNEEFLHDVLSGLRLQQKTLSPKYFYDAQGSKYFDQICQLDEYYPYRTELSLLPEVAGELQKYFTARDVDRIKLVEFGAGSLHKVQPVLDSMTAVREFTAIDISGDHLQEASAELAPLYPNLRIKAVQGDFTKAMQLDLSDATPVGFFPGSTIGNFDPDDALEFLRNARSTLGAGSYMLLGVDTKKDRSTLESAYNDSAGVTARFNKNLLTRINRELGANFDVDAFEHVAHYNDEEGRIEMHLRSRNAQTVSVAGESFAFAEGETIHTENSYKYHPDEFKALTEEAGWQRECLWLADGGIFAITLLYNAG